MIQTDILEVSATNELIVMASSLNLNLPNRRKANKQDPDIRPAAVEEWINALPRGSLSKTGQHLHTFLTDINKLNFRAQDRFACLEQLREPMSFVMENMKPHFLNIDFPLPIKNYQFACATHELHAIMATAYMIVAEDVSKSSAIFRDNTLMAEAIHRAISYQSGSLLTCYQIYSAFQGNNWKVLHSLYAFAEKHKLHLKKIVDEQHQYISKTTITCEYLRILLLYLAEPYHLRHGEVGKIYINIERWLHKLSLHRIDDPDALPATAFIVNLKEDSPPFYKQFSPNIKCPEEIRFIDTTTLSSILEEELARPQDEPSKTLICFEMQKAHLSHDLLRWLQYAWCTRKTRKLPRNQRKDRIEVCFGLNHVHQLIEKAGTVLASPPRQASCAKTSAEVQTARLAEYETQEVNDVNVKETDIWETVYEYVEPDSESENTSKAKQTTPAESESKLKDRWTLINESAGGFCLRCDATGSTNIRVGELVGIHHPGTPDRNWAIGIIRWMKNNRNADIQIGGQLLAPQAQNVNICLATKQIDLNDIQRALWIPENKITQQPASLICLVTPHRVGSVIRMQYRDKEIILRLNKLVGNSGMFAQFLYKVVKEHVEPENKAEDDLDEVWSLI